MSELVKKVQDAIFTAYDVNGIATEKMSRAAILAVLEHYSEPKNLTPSLVSVGDGYAVMSSNGHFAAAAMRAELERLRGDK